MSERPQATAERSRAVFALAGSVLSHQTHHRRTKPLLQSAFYFLGAGWHQCPPDQQGARFRVLRSALDRLRSSRMEPLKREVRLAPTLTTAETLAEDMIAANIKRGWLPGESGD